MEDRQLSSGQHHSVRRSILGWGGALVGAGLLTAIPKRAEAGQQEDSSFNVKKFGATGRRSDNATKAFRDAIAACSLQGGGVVTAPPGEYTVGTVQLLDNITLHIEAGATLFVSQNKADFIPDSRSLIFASGAKNISVTGKGTIDGLAQYDYLDMRGLDPEIKEEIEIARAAGMEIKRYYRKAEAMNVFLFVLNGCDNVQISDVKLINSPLWTVRLNDCNRVHIRGVYLYSDLEKGVNADGIDICSSSNVTISDSIIVTADDAIVLKTIARNGKPANAINNVVVTNCMLSSSSTALMIGTETEADISHVVFSNCVIRNSNKGFGINVQDGATVSNVIFSNLTIETARRHWNWWGSAEMCKFVLKKRSASSKLGSIRDIFIDNIVANPMGTSTIKGHADQPLENIRVTNVQVKMNPEDAKDKRATHALVIDGVTGLQIRNLTVEWMEDKPEQKWGSALVLKNVKDVNIDSFSGRPGLKTSDIPAIVLENVSDGIIRNSAASEGTKTFLSLTGSGTRDIVLQNNLLRKVSKPIIYENDNLKKVVEVN